MTTMATLLLKDLLSFCLSSVRNSVTKQHNSTDEHIIEIWELRKLFPQRQATPPIIFKTSDVVSS